jgi:uncharacterized membrane protein HdeD (DUF308 family)
MTIKKHKLRIRIPKKIKEALITVVGVVLVWRGIWLVLDAVDSWFFGGNHFFTGVLGFAAGFALLYHLDNDLEELRVL